MAFLSSRLTRSIPSSSLGSTLRLVQPPVCQSFQQSLRSRLFHTTVSRRVVHDIKTEQDFKKTISENEFVVVDCFAEWCGPCKMIAPALVEMSEAPELEASVRFVKFDVDQLPSLTAELGVRAMPTFLLYKDGKKMDQVVGANPRGLLKQILAMVN